MVKNIRNKKDNKIDDREYVPIVLSLLDKDENVVSDVQKEILKEEIDELPPIKEGELNVSGIYAYDLGDKVEVKAYIRNGVSDNLNLRHIPFVIVNSKGETLAYQVFNLESLGTLPPHAARPVKLYFDKKNVKVDKIPQDDWRLALEGEFSITAKVKTVYEGLPEDIDVEDKLVFDKFLDELPELKEGEFSISTFSIGIQKDGTILVTSVMRNAGSRPISINKVPVTVIDPNGVVIKSNQFELNNFTVNPYKAKVCNFAFPTGVHVEQDRALNDWSVSYQLVKAPSAKK